MGGKSAPAPDYSPMAAASVAAAEAGERLGNRQLDFAERQYEEMKPLAEAISASQIAAQDEQMRQGRDYYDYMQETFRPLEQGLVADAARFDTGAYREQLASQAAADAARAFGSTQAQTARGMSRMGIAPGSGAFGAQMNQNALAAASQRAGAMTGSRLQSEQLGYARRLDAAGLGRGLAGASTAAYGAATGAGSAGLGSAMAPGNQYMQGMASGAGTIMQGQQLGLQGQGQILNSQTNLYGQSMGARGEALGAALGIGAAFAGRSPSDRRLKKNIELVGRDERTGLPLYEFEYKDGDGRVFLGVMADEVEAYMPEAVGTDAEGFKFVNYAMLGIEMLEVQP